MDPQPSAPPVVAVFVTSDPGPWLEDALSAMALQDYPNLSVLVIDVASAEDPTARVAAVLPTAYVRRLDDRVGFARAANQVMGVVDGASHYLFCHDDVAPAPTAVRLMVEEAFRSNAGIVCPKLVEWERPERLLSVGQSADKVGVPWDTVDRGELDQEQHDAVRDVFCAPGGFTLVRADLFASLGGFDTGIDLHGEDLNLSWRAQVAGARVIVAPEARVRHVEAMASGLRIGWDDRDAQQRAMALAEVHRIRTMLTCYSVFHLVRVVPQALLLTAGQATLQVFGGRRREAAATLLAWPRALRHGLDLWAARRALQKQRSIGDTEIRKLQSRGSARAHTYLRARLAADRFGRGARTVALSDSLRSTAWRIPALAWAVVAVLLLIGTRGLLGGHVPGVGTLPVLSGGRSHWWRLWLSGWRPDGLGRAAPAPPALGLLWLASTMLLGTVGLLKQVLILGPLVVGPLGAYRAARPWGSARGRAAAMLAYAAVPAPYNALAGGRWAGLLLYGAAPWLLSGILRTSGEAPFPSRGHVARVVGLGLLTALTAALVPATLVVVPLVGVGLLVGSVLTRRLVGGLRAVGVALAATALAVVLLLPWSAGVVASRFELFGVNVGPGHRLVLGRVLQAHTGPVGGPLALGLVVAAVLPLLIGKSWRLVWAARLWAVALICWGVVWAASRGSIPIPVPTPEVLLAPAAAALAGAVALGVVAFEVDLPGYRFGWRQVASAIAALAAVVGSLPVLGAALGGRWHVPNRQLADSLGFLGDRRSEGAFRVLWVGDPTALPLGSWPLARGVGYATSENGMPDVTSEWPARTAGATPLLASDLRLARDNLTTRLGHLVAPMAVRYIVMPNRAAPAGSGAPPLPAAADFAAALGLQVDLRTVETDPALTVYENAAWAAERVVLPVAAQALSRSSSPQAAQGAPLAGAQPVLSGPGVDRFNGELPGGQDVLISATSDRRWRLVAGRNADKRPAFGWAMAFTLPPEGGAGTLQFHTPLTRRVSVVAECLLWLVAIAIAIIYRRHQEPRAPDDNAEPDESVPPPLDQPLDVPSLVGARRRPRRVVQPVGFDPADEDWL